MKLKKNQIKCDPIAQSDLCFHDPTLSRYLTSLKSEKLGFQTSLPTVDLPSPTKLIPTRLVSCK